METDFGDNYTQATPENDNTGTYQDNSDSYTRDNEVDQLNSDFANFQQDFSRNSPKDTGIFGGGGAGDFGLGPKSKEEDNFLNQQMVDYYTKARGATTTNPYPDSFFSQLFGVSNVNYTSTLGGPKGVKDVNDLRARQAFGLPSLKTGKSYTANDYYIGQNTNMGEVKSVPSTTRDIMNFMPGGGILNALTGQPGLPQNDPRYQEIMNERAKSANDPTVFDRVSDYVKEVTGFGPKDSGASLAAGSLKEGQFGIPDNRTFDAFGNKSATEINFPNSFSSRPEPEGFNTVINPTTGRMELRENKPNYEQQADLTQTFRNIGNATKDVLGPDGMPVPYFNNENFRFNIGLDPENQEPRATATYNFATG